MTWRHVTLAVMVGMSTTGCGGSTAPTAPPAPPTVTIAMTPGDTGIITGVTDARFNAAATGLASGTVDYAWEFGDGGTASGAAVSHVFATQGTFDVVVTVRDTSGRPVSARKAVAARLIDGFWKSQTYDWWFELRQSGSTITGRVLGSGDNRYSGTVPLTGSIEPPNMVRFTVPDFPPLGFTGPPDPSVDRIVGQIEFLIPRSDILVRMQP